jgi:hypothetical protein
MKVETGGICEARGKSGEYGCLQFLPSTWRQWSSDVLGYTPEMTKTNEMYVASVKIEGWLRDGLDPEQIAVMWNSGGTQHRVGVNKHGVPYNTYAYATKVLQNL